MYDTYCKGLLPELPPKQQSVIFTDPAAKAPVTVAVVTLVRLPPLSAATVSVMSVPVMVVPVMVGVSGRAASTKVSRCVVTYSTLQVEEKVT